MSLETFNPAEPPHKWTPTKPHKVYSPWVLSSRRASRSMSVSQPLSSLSPTKQHVSGATHAPRRPPPPLKPIRSNSYSAASVGAPSEETSQRTTTKVGSRKRRATLDTPQTSAMCLAFQNVSLDTPQTSPTQEESVTASASFRLTQLESVAERSVVAVKPTLPPIQTIISHQPMPLVLGEPRLQLSPASTASTTSNPALLPPSPIPSFPPFTPRETPQTDIITIGAGHATEDQLQVPSIPTKPPTLDHTHPAYYIVPSTCDKRRLETADPVDAPSNPDAPASRPVKKLKQSNGHGRAVTRLSTSSLPELIMPTAIDVVDFIDRRGGTCYEGEVFMRFRTGDSEHVRSVVNDIIQLFARVDVGKDGSRWVTLCPGVSSRPIRS